MASVDPGRRSASHGGRGIDEEAFELDEQFPLVYDELRRIAEMYLERERAPSSLQPTSLLHEAYLRLSELKNIRWRDRLHFFGAASKIMRRVLVDRARQRAAKRRGGEARRISLTDSVAEAPDSEVDILALDEALTALAELNARHAHIVELRFFGGLKVVEVARHLGVSPSTVAVEWRIARAWLNRRLDHHEEG